MTRRLFLGSLAAGPVPAPADDETGFVSLFDGRSLAGWNVVDGPESAFYVKDGAIVIHRGSGFPAWLRTQRRYENFDFRCEVFIEGWANSGVYIHAPVHGRPTWTGLKINLFQKHDDPPLAESMGAIFPLVAPRKVNVRSRGQWNSIRIVSQWPSLRVWINEELVQDMDLARHSELRYRLRSGYIGIESLSYPLRFRNLRIKELPGNEQWITLYAGPSDLEKNWIVTNGKARWEPVGPMLRADGLGYLGTRERFRDFEFQCYIRGSHHHNGGIMFRGPAEPSSARYEIQLHDVEGAVYPTGSLYGFQRCRPYPRIEPERWFPFQLLVDGSHCVVRVNGDTVVDYDKLEQKDSTPVMLQAHEAGKWIEYKEIRIRRLG
ncbi:MAG TPA: DUF1080 domain-containing protein [Bryobacteraceae bacterium]|nr:DUF1080 domain-containing protein [Bryobacteraceae bacterium]